MSHFHIWTIGCQMNKADSTYLAKELEKRGHRQVDKAEDADLIILNSCVIRQSAEDKVRNKLVNMKALKMRKPGLTVALAGCLVDSDTDRLKRDFPYCDIFVKPGELDDLLVFTGGNTQFEEEGLPISHPDSPTAFVPIIQGCDNFCSYCIVPYRRGREKSRRMEEIVRQVQGLADQGIKEVTLLGQNVNSYGHDLPERPDLADLLSELNQIEGLARLRFVTSHPKDMSRRIIDAIASLDKVCEHLSLPFQAGDNEILTAMRRGYTIEQYRDLLGRIISAVPNIALSTDLIVGFPGETHDQFERSLALLHEFHFDTVHVSAYSPRSGTIAWREMEDNVHSDEKTRRLQQVEDLQKKISFEKNSKLVGKTLEVLVEAQKGDNWQGRTRSDKLVFFSSPTNCLGQLLQVHITQCGHWSLRGEAV